MRIIDAPLPGLLVLAPTVYKDSRGYFMESFNQSVFEEVTGLKTTFIQDNESQSTAGVLRGMHFQAPPFEQAKLVRVTQGAVLDVVVDIRIGSPTYGQFAMVELTELNKHQLYIPPGFAHGFYTLQAQTHFLYKCSGYYNKTSEGCLLWNDTTVGIPWPDNKPNLSPKDMEGTPLDQLNTPFSWK